MADAEWPWKLSPKNCGNRGPEAPDVDGTANGKSAKTHYEKNIRNFTRKFLFTKFEICDFC